MIRDYKGAGILMFRRNGNGFEVFLGQRKYNPGRGKWSIPGGGKERKDRDYREAAERELMEESGLVLRQIEHMDCTDLKISIPFFHWMTFIVMVRGHLPAPRPSEFFELKWIRLEDLHKYPHGIMLEMEIRHLKRYLRKNGAQIEEFSRN